MAYSRSDDDIDRESDQSLVVERQSTLHLTVLLLMLKLRSQLTLVNCKGRATILDRIK